MALGFKQIEKMLLYFVKMTSEQPWTNRKWYFNFPKSMTNGVLDKV